jgi:hypothetical protein
VSATGQPASAPQSTPTIGEDAPEPAESCSPRSPATEWKDGGLIEVHGDAGGAQLWALVFPVFPEPDGTVMKIVWRMTGSGPLRLAAEHPDGLRLHPTSGPSKHTGSTWDRPGEEWGSVWTFPKGGCWRITARRGSASGNVWIAVPEDRESG